MTMILTLEEGIITLFLCFVFVLMYFRQKTMEGLVKNAFELLGIFFFGFLAVFPIIWLLGIILKIILFIMGENLFVMPVMTLGILLTLSVMLVSATGVPTKIAQWLTKEMRGADKLQEKKRR